MGLDESPTCMNDAKVTSSPREYPFFFDASLMREYQAYQNVYFDLTVMLLVFSLAICFYFGRCNFTHPFDDGIYFTCSLMSNTCSFVLYLIIFLSFTARHYVVKRNSLYRLSELILNSPWVGDMFKDLIAISGTFGVGFGLLGRVIHGQCVENVSLWEAQRCNPMANSHALPQDHVIYLLMMPIIVQSVVSGMTYRGTIFCWCVSTSFSILCIIIAHGWLEVWSLLSSLVILVVIYKYEKLARLTFMHNKSKLSVEMEKREVIALQQRTELDLLSEKIKHSLEIFTIKSHEECTLMKKEQAQMVAMIGNIAHDLKTPLQSFAMDLEFLKSDEGFCQYLDSMPDDENGPRSILENLESTCCFMSMAMNRSIDFAKATGNIALVPHLETVNIPDALSSAVVIIRHMKSSSDIVVHPFPATLHPNMITDKHWLKENILCLLSNAIKYSNGGKVSVTVTHIAAPLQEPPSLLKPDSDAMRSRSCLDYSDDSCSTSSHNMINTSTEQAAVDNLTSVSKSGFLSPSRLEPLQREYELCAREAANIPEMLPLGLKQQTEARDVLSSSSSTSRDGNVSCTVEINTDGGLISPLVESRAANDEYPHPKGHNSHSSSVSPTAMMMIAIEDEGIGIPESSKDDLFLPFKQVQRLAGGTGLGLYSLSKRMQALKGTRGVRPRSDGKQGSVFWLAIPYRPDYQDDNLSGSDSATATSCRFLSRRSSIDTIHQPLSAVSVPISIACPVPVVDQTFRFLVVDDSLSILKVLQRALTNKKYSVETADNGSAGLDRLIRGYNSQDFDVVLMDLQMPVMDGIEAVRRYREFEATQRCAADVNNHLQTQTVRPEQTSSYSSSGESSLSYPTSASIPPRKNMLIVGMSANSDDDTKQYALNAGMNSFIAKPFTMDQLLPLLQQLIYNQ